jgi:hypothetical protein
MTANNLDDRRETVLGVLIAMQIVTFFLLLVTSFYALMGGIDTPMRREELPAPLILIFFCLGSYFAWIPFKRRRYDLAIFMAVFPAASYLLYGIFLQLRSLVY